MLLPGPADTPYEGGIFRVEVNLPENYPLWPPKIKFLTKLFHPNFNECGSACLRIMGDNWSPKVTIADLMRVYSDLLACPNFDEPLDPHVAKVFVQDLDHF
mmetsp:Transcript_4191/g.5174  ORF Transcript_4191/g.5174 Transcript_4191/m.5174 type:complete len:101 (-) Transcript_4191:75-377(-)